MGPDLDLDLDLEPPRPEIIENHRSETIGGIAGGSDPESSPGGAQKPDLELDLDLEWIFNDFHYFLEMFMEFHTFPFKSNDST